MIWFIKKYTPEQFIEILGKEPIEKKALILSYASPAYIEDVHSLSKNIRYKYMDFLKYIDDTKETAKPAYINSVDSYLQRITQPEKLTVFESVYWWLIDIISFQEVWTVIDLENIPNWTQFLNGALFSSPNDIHTPLLAGNWKHTEFKSLYLRRPFSEFQERLSNEVFLEKITELLREKNENGIMPNDHREWISISINAGIYPAQRDEGMRFADYLVNLKLEYIQ